MRALVDLGLEEESRRSVETWSIAPQPKKYLSRKCVFEEVLI